MKSEGARNRLGRRNGSLQSSMIILLNRLHCYPYHRLKREGLTDKNNGLVRT